MPNIKTEIPLLQHGFYVGNNFNAIIYGMSLHSVPFRSALLKDWAW